MAGTVARILRSLSRDKRSASAEFERFVDIVARLRDPQGGCPWDLEQTHDSLKPYLIEEAFEVLEAIDRGPTMLRDELGDLLLQVILHAQIASERSEFTISEVLARISEKMIRRHPHVFGTGTARTSTEVLENWETIKQRELAKDVSILDGIPRAMPALLRAQRTGDKVSRVGFDWIRADDVIAKIEEELHEFLDAARHGASSGTTANVVVEELGDLLFSLAQLARKLNLNSEDLLNQATVKFTARFKALEARASRPLKEMSAAELDELWQEVKSAEASGHSTAVPGGKPLPTPLLFQAYFEFTAPTAHYVEVVGSFCDWKRGNYPLMRRDDGVWQLMISLPRGRYEYRYLVDGAWANDQRPVECVATTLGSWNCVVEVGNPPSHGDESIQT